MDTVLGMVQGFEAADLKNQAMSLQNADMAIQIQKDQRALQNANKMQSLLAQGLSQAPSVQGTTGNIPDTTQSQLQSANQLISAGQRILSADPKAGEELIKHGQEIQKNVEQLKNEQLKNKQENLKILDGWINQIDSQQSLDSVRQQVQQRYPGMWESNKLPNVYDEKTAPLFKQLAAASQTALQQAETQQHQIELSTAKATQADKLEKAHQEAVLSKIKVATARENLKAKQEDKTAYEKMQAALSKEDVRHNNEIKKITLDTKKYPAEAPKVGWVKELMGEKPQASPREQAIAAENEAHEKNVADIKGRAPKGSIPTQSEETQYGAKADVLGKLKAANPEASDAELEAFARERGYIK